MSKAKTVKKTSKKVSEPKSSLSIKYDKGMNRQDEFKTRILERIIIRILDILENKRP